MTIIYTTAEDTCEYLKCVLQVVAEWRGSAANQERSPSETQIEPWFRGQSRASHKLVPSAYRGERDHGSMFNRFKAAGHTMLSPTPNSEWEWYFAAQHYELPTRLLDWTEDPLAALYFAVRGMSAQDAKVEVTSDDLPVVWVMDAGSLNYLSYGVDEVVVPSDDGPFSRHWLPSACGLSAVQFNCNETSYSNEKPIAIWPTRATPRIIAQRGTFTVHGTSKSSIEDLFQGADCPHSKGLIRIEIARPHQVDRELEDLGVTRLRLFPEIQSLAGQLRADYPSK